MALNPKQKLFCEEYVKNGYNPMNAYRVAYAGSSEASLNANPYRLMKKPEVREYITELENEIFESNRITAEKIAHELSLMAFGQFDENISASVKLKALDLLQKQFGLQNSKVEVNGKQDVIINILGDENNEAGINEPTEN